jgi:hypothetical protein
MVTTTSAAAAADQRPTYAEPLRTAIVVAVCGAFVVTVAVLTAGGVVSALFDSGQRLPDDDV